MDSGDWGLGLQIGVLGYGFCARGTDKYSYRNILQLSFCLVLLLGSRAPLGR
jgi:hypothetical protein